MMRVGLLVVVCLLVAACSGQVRRPPVNEVTRIPEQGNWFCQLAPAGEGWECVQDPALAEDPAPERLPHPPETTAPDAAPSPGEPLPPDPSEDFGATARSPDTPDGGPASETPPVSNTPPAPDLPPVSNPPASDAPAVSDAAPASEPAAPPADAAAADAVPEYVRRAYQPPAPVPLMELPPDLYAVQVLAMNSREEIDAFVRRHRLPGLTSARVESDGRIYYVLLLGIYDDIATARAILTDLPPPFDTGDAWVRPLGSLQAAMARADALARSGRP